MTTPASTHPRCSFRPLTPFSATAVLMLAACKLGSGGTPGSGELKTETRPVTGFTQIELAGSGEVTVTQTGTESLTIEAESNLLPKLTSTVANGRLVLDTSGSIAPTRPIRYMVTVRDLAVLEVSGAGKATVNNLHTNTLTVRLSGAGSVVASGRVESQDVAISGAGSYDGEHLLSKTATVSESGVGAGVVNASDALKATISGVGGLEYIGDPKVTQSTSGVGSVRKKG